MVEATVSLPFSPSTYWADPPGYSDSPAEYDKPATAAELEAMRTGTEWWLADDERDSLAERGAFDRDDECPICGAPLDGPCWPFCTQAKVSA